MKFIFYRGAKPHWHNTTGASGDAHCRKPPALARHHGNHSHELFWQEVLVRNTELIGHHQQGELRKGQKETPHVQPAPRILLAGIHLGWTRRAPPGKTLSQNDWLKPTRKLIPLPQNPRLQATWQSSPPGFPYPTALCPGAPSQLNLLLCQHVCLLGQFISECLTRAQFWALEGVPLLATGPPELIPEQCTPWIYFSEFLSYMRWSTDTLISLSIKQWWTVLFHNRVNKANILLPSLWHFG